MALAKGQNGMLSSNKEYRLERMTLHPERGLSQLVS